MSAEKVNPADFVQVFKTADSPAAVDRFFEVVNTMAPEDKAAVASAIETVLVADFKEGVPTGDALQETRLFLLELDAKRGTTTGDYMVAQIETTMGTDESLIAAQAYAHIHQIKGEDADPMIKAYAKAAAEMDAEAFSTAVGQMQLAVKVQESLAPAAAPAVNPFAPKPAAGPGTP